MTPRLSASHLLPFLGPGALLVVQPERPGWPLLLVAGLAASHLLEPRLAGSEAAGRPRLQNLLLLAVIVGLGVFAPAPLLDWFLRFAVLLGVSLAFSPGEPHRRWKLFVVTFLLVLIAAAQTEEAVFGFPFLAYVTMMPVALSELALEGREERLVRRPREGRTGLVLGVLTLLVFFALPRSARNLMGRGLLAPPTLATMSDSVTLENITDIKQSTRVAMRVTVDGPIPEDQKWRAMAFDAFDGKTWSINRRMDEPIGFGGRKTLLDVLPTPPGARLLRQEFALEPGLSQALFAARDVVKVDSFEHFIKLNRRGLDLLFPYVPRGTMRYAAYSAPGAAAPEESEELERYLALPPLPARIGALAARIAGGATGPEQRMRALERFFLQEFSYSLAVVRPDGVDPLEDFLFENRRGHCEFFASGLVVLARSLKIPARLVDGFVRGEYSDLAGGYVVRRSDAHAWAEAYVPGKGWLEFDPTPPAPPELGVLTRFRALQRYLVDFWNRYIADFSIIEQRAMIARAAAALRSAPGWVVPIASLLAAGYVAFRIRRALRASRPTSSRSALGPLLVRAVHLCRPLGIDWGTGETAREVLARVEQQASLPALAALVALHERSCYGPGGDEDAARQDGRQLLRRLRAEVRAARA